MQAADVDGCSGGMTKLWNKLFKADPPWNHCCNHHDMAYNRGGDSKDRLRADLRLATCVSKNGHPLWAALMYSAVRVFGRAHWSYRAYKRRKKVKSHVDITPVHGKFYVLRLRTETDYDSILREYDDKMAALESLEHEEMIQGFTVTQYVKVGSGELVMRPVWLRL